MLYICMKYRELLKILQQAGWIEVRQVGSHKHFKHPEKTNLITVAFHGSNQDLKKGTLNQILKDAGLK